MSAPVATYRIQLCPAFGFNSLEHQIEYLKKLGITHVYLSPIFQARSNSQHGYDVVNPNKINPELGSSEDYENFCRALREAGMQCIQDIVPNHMAFDRQNLYLTHMLEFGPHSPYYHFFDIEWDHPYESLKGKLLAPFLGRFYGQVLDEKEIRLQYDQDGLSICYYDVKLPVKIESYISILTHHIDLLKVKLSEQHPDFTKFLGHLNVFRDLPNRLDKNNVFEQIRLMKEILWDLYRQNDAVRAHIDGAIAAYNEQERTLLDKLLSEQFFRLAYWKVAAEEINYRRFFNINELICLRQQEDLVFEETHRLLFQLMEEGKIQGLRIDRIDGLYDPKAYLERLKTRFKNHYIVVEKVLEHPENLPENWPIDGTTGYDFMNLVNGLYCKKDRLQKMQAIYARYTGMKMEYMDLLIEKKRMIVGKLMAGDIDNLAHFIKKISAKKTYGTDLTLYGLKRALVEVMACFPIYRTYVNSPLLSAIDRYYIDIALHKAKERLPDFIYELDFIESVFSELDKCSEEEKTEMLDFIMRFQQYTGPLMAKGFEDTTLYIYNRLISLNEVGGMPDQFGLLPEEFHDVVLQRSERWPLTMNATSTHDTKRGEDVRARINVLSEMPEEWEKHLKQWSKLNRRKKKIVKKIAAPHRNDEYFLYQTLIGSFPLEEPVDLASYQQRIKQYIIKAVREAKVHTAWLKPDEDYEQAYLGFIEHLLQNSPKNLFLESLKNFLNKISFYGMLNSLSQTLLKICCPGVPDFYQGTELWDLHLVDPDNRAPVDFKLRANLLELCGPDHQGVHEVDLEKILNRWKEGITKLFLIKRLLDLRNQNPVLFQKGLYQPLYAQGRRKDHLVSFMLSHEDHRALVVAPRFFSFLSEPGQYPLGKDVWEDTHFLLPDFAGSVWYQVLDGSELYQETQEMELGQIIRHFPCAVLLNKGSLNPGFSSDIVAKRCHGL